jgi:regulator of protease activity HflC (stomatin/prohibitin superfamily)
MKDTGNVRIVASGLAFKRPWPIDIAYKYPTKKIMQISIGFVPRLDPKTGEPEPEPLLWGEAHHEEEYQLLVAGEQTGEKLTAGAVPVNLLIAAVPVQYRIKDLYSFIYNHSEPEKLLESICYRELTKFAASAKLGLDDSTSMDKNLLGAGRAEAKRTLTNNIQAAADKAELGVEIVFLGLQGIHPPAEVAPDYQKLIGAIQKKQALILDAHARRNRDLTTLAGSVAAVDRLYALTTEYQAAKEQKNSQKIKELGDELDLAFTQSKGDIFKTLRQAQSHAFEKATLARATGQRFADQLKAYTAAKEVYKREQRLVAFEEALENIRKYVIVGDPNNYQIFEIDLQEKLTPSLYELTGYEETSEK